MIEIYDQLNQQAESLEAQAATHRQVAGQLKATKAALLAADAAIQKALGSFQVEQVRGLAVVLPKAEEPEQVPMTDEEIAASKAETNRLTEQANAMLYGKKPGLVRSILTGKGNGKS